MKTRHCVGLYLLVCAICLSAPAWGGDAGVVYELSVPTPGAQPLGITVDPQGQVWFAEFGGMKIGCLDPSDGSIREFPVSHPPRDLQVHPDGRVLFTADDAGAGYYGVLDPTTNTLVEYPTGLSDASAVDCTLDPFGAFWFNCWVATGVFRVDANGMSRFIPPTFGYISGVSEDSTGNLWFTVVNAYEQSPRLLKLNPRSAQPGSSAGFTEISLPYASATLRAPLAANGKIWYTLQDLSKIGCYDPDTGVFSDFATPTSNSAPHRLAADRWGRIWYTGHLTDTIGVLDPRTGTITEYQIPTSNSLPAGIAVDLTADVVWFTERAGNRIGSLKIQPPDMSYQPNPPTLIHYVSLSGGHVPPFASWATAATNIQAAIDAATIPGALVLVSNGVYSTGAYPTPSGSANESRIVVTSAVSVVSVNGPEHATIMGADKVHCAYLTHGARLSGFTLDAEGTGPRGGVKCYAGAVLEHCVVRNGSNSDGGNVSSYSATVRNCLLTGGNSYRGGGIFLYGPEARLEHCTIVSNRAQKGGGVFCEGGTVLNCIVWSNSANESGANWALQGGSITYSCTTPDPGGVGNMTGHPVLSADYALSSNSPCIDAGMDMPLIITDLDGTPRPLDGNNDGTSRWDIGAYEFDPGIFVPAIHYVDINSSNPMPPYLTWAAAATNMQDAIDVARNGDTVLVADGVYETGGRLMHGSLTNRVVIDKEISVKSVNGPTVTAIRGAGPLGPSAVRCVYVGTNATIEGFTLTDGHTRNSWGYSNNLNGGGAYCESSGVLSNCMLIGNNAWMDGGGAYGGIQSECVFSSNSAINGGGTCYGVQNHCVYSNNVGRISGGGAYGGLLNHCVLVDNKADTYGGGARKGVLNNCTLIGNYSGQGGGAYQAHAFNCIIKGNTAMCYGGGAFGGTLDTCLISDNTSTHCGGGGVYGGTLRNCTLTGNSGATGGGASDAVLQNCVVYYNKAPSSPNVIRCTISYSCTTPDPGGTGNTTNEPLFVDSALGDYRMASNSPCIDAGMDMPLIITDLDGTPRPLDGNNDGVAKWDMGAYEFVNALADTDGDGMVDNDELRAGYSPLNSSEFFQLRAGVEQAQEGERSLHGTKSSSEYSLQWSSVEGRRYNILRSTNLLAGFTVLQGPIDAQPPVNTFPAMMEEDHDSLFYRIELAE